MVFILALPCLSFFLLFDKVDYESYDWTRLDASAASTREIVDEFLLGEEDKMTYKPHKPEVYDKYKGLTLYSANIFK